MTLTTQSILEAIYKIDALGRATPDPLRGATELHAAEGMVDIAQQLAAARQGPLLIPPLVLKSSLVPSGFVVGMRGSEVVLLVRRGDG